ncbi:hypothetical protein AAHA92_33123 [Salvia divinorum]|uniref:Uncharacterized protein n=1 Tax=Salvia divinorum TaxID=28513 RepID=A0ABD1FMX9_SALDI
MSGLEPFLHDKQNLDSGLVITLECPTILMISPYILAASLLETVKGVFEFSNVPQISIGLCERAAVPCLQQNPKDEDLQLNVKLKAKAAAITSSGEGIQV